MTLKKNQGSARTASLISIGLLAFAGVIVWLLFSTQPVAQKEGATKRAPMMVEVITVNQADYTPTIKALGLVKPVRQVSLQAQVSGEVIAVSDHFVPGNLVKKGQWLAKLDDRDYQLLLRKAEANLAVAESAYAIEMGEQARAKSELSILTKAVSPQNKSLILREPQKRQVEAKLKSARAEVAEAELALERCLITMPFDGQILSQDVNLGSLITSNDTLARVVGTDQYWIESTIPLSQLKWLVRLNEPSSPNHASVKIQNPIAWQKNIVREGVLKQVIAELDANTKMARVLIAVNDPLGIASLGEPISEAPLIAGSFVETHLPAKTLVNVIRLDLAFLRKNNTVWVMQEQALDIRPVNVAFKDERFAYIDKGLESSERVITTDLSSIRQGASVRLKPNTPQMQAVGKADEQSSNASAKSQASSSQGQGQGQGQP